MISIIVATDDDLLIGKKDSSNGMPWHNKEDLQHFKKTTLHQTILMGKTTYMAIGRPLPHRKTIVVTRGELDDERVEVKHDLVETIQEYKNKKEDLFKDKRFIELFEVSILTESEFILLILILALEVTNSRLWLTTVSALQEPLLVSKLTV